MWCDDSRAALMLPGQPGHEHHSTPCAHGEAAQCERLLSAHSLWWEIRPLTCALSACPDGVAQAWGDRFSFKKGLEPSSAVLSLTSQKDQHLHCSFYRTWSWWKKASVTWRNKLKMPGCLESQWWWLWMHSSKCSATAQGTVETGQKTSPGAFSSFDSVTPLGCWAGFRGH